MLKQEHNSVLKAELLASIQPSNDKLCVDMTFGAGGHSELLLNNSNCSIIALDRDINIIPIAEKFKEKYQNRFIFYNDKFSNIKDIINDMQINGFIFDLGVSSMQLDRGERGFSFQKDGPLSMLMDGNDNNFNAELIVNTYLEDELAEIIWNYGDEKKARKIAKLICLERQIKTIKTTIDLADIILKAVGGFNNYRDNIHPTTRTFQAIRIVVNNELGELDIALKIAIDSVSSEGFIAVITFHSLEDQIVKKHFSSVTKKEAVNKYKENRSISPFYYPTEKVIFPSKDEIYNNPRSRSAKLRVIKKMNEK